MLFIADIPPVTEAQEARYEFIKEYSEIYDINRESQNEYIALIFIRQANKFVKLSENTKNEKARENYKRLALLSFQAYLNKAGE